MSPLTEDGYRGYFRPRFAPDRTSPAEVVLEPVRGRVVDRDSRNPVAGALVWVRRTRDRIRR